MQGNCNIAFICDAPSLVITVGLGDTCVYHSTVFAGTLLHFMDPATYEQEAVAIQTFGEQHDYLAEDMEATLSFHDGKVISGQACSRLTQCWHKWLSWHDCTAFFRKLCSISYWLRPLRAASEVNATIRR